MTPADVVKLIKEKDAKFVDLRFTDTIGKEQHVTIPTRLVDEGFFKDGKMFDGSSIAGWKGINESDMILMPDPSTAVIDPFYEETTLNLRCDVIEPMTMQGYGRDPRSLAKRAEAHLKASGIADSALFGPENEFFIFDNVTVSSSMNGCAYEVDAYEGAWIKLQVPFGKDQYYYGYYIVNYFTKAGLGLEGLIEVISCTGLYGMIGLVLNSFDMPPQPGVKPLS